MHKQYDNFNTKKQTLRMEKIKLKNIKRNIIITAMLVTFLLGGLFIGDKYGASSNWVSIISNSAGTALDKTASSKTDALLKDSGITDQMRIIMNPEIEAQQQELERLLEEYYQLKIQGLTDTPEYKSVQASIKKSMSNILGRYKADIDAAFKGQ